MAHKFELRLSPRLSRVLEIEVNSGQGKLATGMRNLRDHELVYFGVRREKSTRNMELQRLTESQASGSKEIPVPINLCNISMSKRRDICTINLFYSYILL